MSSRAILVLVGLSLLTGLVLGLVAGLAFAEPTPPSADDVVSLQPADQTDYIIMVAEAYAADRDLRLAQDRLRRLKDAQVNARVRGLANEYAPQRDLIATNLALLAVALGARDQALIALSGMATPTVPPKLLSSLAPTRLSPQTPIPAFPTAPPARFVIVPNENPYIVVLGDTATPRPPTRTPTRRPPTRTPTATPTPAPPPTPIWEPSFPDRWPPGIYYIPANVEPGTRYWRLVKATYCDFTEDNFGCPDLPGNRSGTSIYVMTGGAPIDVIRPDGVNVGGDRSVVGDLKAPDDPCLCTWTFLVSDYKISVAGAPSDAIGGFSLYTVSGNVLQGHAHVRYFLYFDYVVR